MLATELEVWGQLALTTMPLESVLATLTLSVFCQCCSEVAAIAKAV